MKFIGIPPVAPLPGIPVKDGKFVQPNMYPFWSPATIYGSKQDPMDRSDAIKEVFDR